MVSVKSRAHQPFFSNLINKRQVKKKLKIMQNYLMGCGHEMKMEIQISRREREPKKS